MKYTTKRKCPKCGKEYMCEISEQEPGFRDVEVERCPYCNDLVRVSMEYEFFTYELEEKHNG